MNFLASCVKAVATWVLFSCGLRLTRASRRQSQVTHARLEPVILEDRICPAPYYWRPLPLIIGGFSNVGSDGRNWTDAADGANPYLQAQKPGANDTLFFDRNGARWCTLDANSNTTFAAIIVTDGFNGQIGIVQDTQFTGGGTGIASSIDSICSISSVDVNLQNLVFRFAGSTLTMLGGVHWIGVNFINAQNNTANITGSTNWREDILRNQGTLNWSGQNTITLIGADIVNDGSMNMSGAGTIANIPRAGYGSRVTNRGTLTKDGAGTTTLIAADFVNRGWLWLSNGTLELTGSKAEQGSFGQGYALTNLNGGSLELGPQLAAYNIWEGGLSG